MNQEKIGKFIAESRKEKNMTQQELADKLGVTDRAVSHWENGRRLPDYSIIEKLCDELNININELFYAKKIDDSDYKEISEENLRLYIKEKYRKYFLIKNMIYGGIFGILIYIIIFLIFIKWIVRGGYNLC